MSLPLVLYLIDILGNLQAATKIILALSFICLFLFFCAYNDDIKIVKKFLYLGTPWLMMLATILTVLPSKTTMYEMLAVKYGNQALNIPEAKQIEKEAMKALETKLKEIGQSKGDK